MRTEEQASFMDRWIAIFSLLVAIIGSLAAVVVVPEFRCWVLHDGCTVQPGTMPPPPAPSSAPKMRVISFEEYVADDPNGRRCPVQGLAYLKEKCDGETVCSFPPAGKEICDFDQDTGHWKYTKGEVRCGNRVGLIDSQKYKRSDNYILKCSAEDFIGPDIVK